MSFDDVAVTRDDLARLHHDEVALLQCGRRHRLLAQAFQDFGRRMSGEDAALTAKTIVYIKGSGTWDKTFDIISGSFKKIKTYLDK